MAVKIGHRILMFCCMFVAMGALFGSAKLLLDPTGASMGMDGLLDNIARLPLPQVLLRDYTFFAVALLVLIAVPNLFGAAMLLNGYRSGILVGTVSGILLVLWTLVQVIVLPLNPMTCTFAVIGIVQTTAGILAFDRNTN